MQARAQQFLFDSKTMMLRATSPGPLARTSPKLDSPPPAMADAKLLEMRKQNGIEDAKLRALEERITSLENRRGEAAQPMEAPELQQNAEESDMMEDDMSSKDVVMQSREPDRSGVSEISSLNVSKNTLTPEISTETTHETSQDDKLGDQTWPDPPVPNAPLALSLHFAAKVPRLDLNRMRPSPAEPSATFSPRSQTITE
ncbi:hypothetical protein GUITHDRAFT_101257 [Guillardia theta CCMP2712]|uniref:Uncharacterized protein n=1 Tax=Guillardia theta (strain CCMP2712) TaxID=905079 RepID=L1JWT9_GUITC|nr:hypothetical protein GUITHDRAFT_101257 [Guillardia theta CCMP2712]EKX52807.1 hypothetical protein GUITHDRAFT_101257 [Guillardia theta CCMP2712]|eukprot:XP_005839787.1 hypothetical protein GUITHDRAFT_101257 [Guillardia theta CCMP2712]